MNYVDDMYPNSESGKEHTQIVLVKSTSNKLGTKTKTTKKKKKQKKKKKKQKKKKRCM